MEDERTPWELASEWFARTLAIVVVMVAPGALGVWLDKQLGTSFLTLGGFLLGMVAAIGMLLLYTRIKPTEAMTKTARRSSADSASGSPAGDSLASTSTPASRRSAELPSDAKLPHLPGAEVLEPPKRDE